MRVNGRIAGRLWWMLACGAGVSAAQAQQLPIAGGIYTCVDAKGRTLTADRPIAECADREQRVFGANGTVKARVSPSLTALERAELDRKEKIAAEERNRLDEEKRRSRALFVRYPNKTVHDKERAQALGQVAILIETANTRLKELQQQRKAIDVELEFYRKDPKKIPARLHRQIEQNQEDQEAQKRFVAEQGNEIQRIQARFDAELVQLRPLWAAASIANPVMSSH